MRIKFYEISYIIFTLGTVCVDVVIVVIVQEAR